MAEAAEVSPEELEEDLPVMTKVAILFVALGQEAAGEVLKYLADYEVEEITQAIANLKNVSVAQQDKVLEEFEQHMLAGAWVSQGGLDFARQALERAVGPRRAQEILDRVMHTVSSGFFMLKNVAPDQIAPFISQEHPQTIALILSQLESTQAAGILTQLPERMQSDVAYRIATMENITPTVLKQIEESLEASLRDILGGNKDVGGPKVVADILNLTGTSAEKNVLDQMDAQDPEVAESVRNLMFVFADIVKLSDREIQVLLREVDQKDLVVALKAAEDELKTKILNNMSERVRTFLSEEMEFLGPMRLSEVEEVQLRIVQQVRQLEEQGQITVVRGDSEDTFV
ncbi:MAG: flagellar motor switch protein FliG [Candidatus Latescibacteria bacterium]|nr:flagellar motor switch protein FliG [Candidatus Latescibacterota bacterium]